jgi:hypothetical protein
MSIRLALLELMAAHRRDLAPSFFRKKKKQKMPFPPMTT